MTPTRRRRRTCNRRILERSLTGDGKSVVSGHRRDRIEQRSVIASRADRRRRRRGSSSGLSARRVAGPSPQSLDHIARQIAHPRLEAPLARSRVRVDGQRNRFARTDRARAPPQLSLPHRRDGRAQSRKATSLCRTESRRRRKDGDSAARARLRYACDRGRQPVQRFRHAQRQRACHNARHARSGGAFQPSHAQASIDHASPRCVPAR